MKKVDKGSKYTVWTEKKKGKKRRTVTKRSNWETTKEKGREVVRTVVFWEERYGS